MTGSRVGAVGPLMIGSANSGGRMTALVSPLTTTIGRPGTPSTPPPGKSIVNGFATAAFGVLGGGGEDGSVAYRQLWQSDNPYDPKFEWHPATGISHVGPIQPIDGRHDTSPVDASPSSDE
jgi:hypothetical protein